MALHVRAVLIVFSKLVVHLELAVLLLAVLVPAPVSLLMPAPAQLLPPPQLLVHPLMFVPVDEPQHGKHQTSYMTPSHHHHRSRA